MAELQITASDGLLAIDPEASADFLSWNPLQFHAEFHRICQQIFAQINPQFEAGETMLHTRGHEVVHGCIPMDVARSLSDAYSDEIEDQNETANTKLAPSSDLALKVVETVRRCLDSPLARHLETYLGCYFRVDHVELMRSRDAQVTGKSYLWHRDFDPMSKIHLLIYLTDCGPDAPATIFTSLEDTRRCANEGYAFPPRSKRVADLAEVLADDVPPPVLSRPELKAGDATLFTPSRILHRGDASGAVHRDLLVLNILPSLNPWNMEIDHLGKERLFQGRSTLFYDPFTREKPSISGYDGVDVPFWAQQGYHFPLV